MGKELETHTSPRPRIRVWARLGAAMLLVIVGAAASVSVRAQEITLKIHHFLPLTSNPHKFFIQPWADKVTKESGGRIKFQIYPAMQLGGTPPQLYDQAKDGVADIVWTLPGLTAGRFPRVEVFELPFMMTDAEATSKAAWDYVQRHAPDEFAGVHLLSVFVHTPGHLFLNKRPVKTLDDLRGLKLRAPTRQTTKLLSALGATPVGMPAPQVPDALAKGVIDGAMVPYEIVPTLKLHELTRYVSETDARFPALYTAVFVFAMNKAKYQSLPAELKRVIDANSGSDVGAWIVRQAWIGPDRLAKRTVQQRGNAITLIAPAELERWRQRTRALADAWQKEVSAKGFDGKKLLDAARALIAQHAGKK
jgi:TRAP-type transport system periplasmic protein